MKDIVLINYDVHFGVQDVLVWLQEKVSQSFGITFTYV